jgi:hypothetical protein
MLHPAEEMDGDFMKLNWKFAPSMSASGRKFAMDGQWSSA